MRRVKAIVALLVVAPLFLAGAGGSSAFVLCQGMDGHVEVEAAVGGICASGRGKSSDEAANYEASPAIRERDDHCGPCSDRPLKLGTANRSKLFVPITKTEIGAPVGKAHRSATYDDAERRRPSFVLASTTDAGHTTLSCLRAVSLLI